MNVITFYFAHCLEMLNIEEKCYMQVKSKGINLGTDTYQGLDIFPPRIPPKFIYMYFVFFFLFQTQLNPETFPKIKYVYLSFVALLTD